MIWKVVLLSKPVLISSIIHTNRGPTIISPVTVTEHTLSTYHVSALLSSANPSGTGAEQQMDHPEHICCPVFVLVSPNLLAKHWPTIISPAEHAAGFNNMSFTSEVLLLMILKMTLRSKPVSWHLSPYVCVYICIYMYIKGL